MKTSLKLALTIGLTCAGADLAASSASAMPMNGLDPAIATSADVAQGVQDVRWICGPWGCHWAPGWGYYGGWRRPYGYYGGWHRGYGWHGGWHRHW